MDLAMLNDDDLFIEEMKDEQEFHQIETQLSQLMESTLAVETYGCNPTALGMLQLTNLLSSTSLDAIAIESFSYDKPSGDESQLAMEALLDKIKETAANWSAKILSVAKKFSDTVLTILTPIYDKAKDLIKKLAEKSWDKVKSAGRAIAAHPVRTVLVVVASIAAVAALMAYCGSSLPGGSTTREAFASFFDKVRDQTNKIPWPFGKVTSTVSETQNFKIDRVFPPSKVVPETAEKLGWTASAVNSLGKDLDRAWAATKHGASALGIRMVKVTSIVGHATFGKAQQFKKAAPQAVYNMTGSSEAAHATAFAIGGIYFGACLSLVFAIYRLVKKIIIGGFRLILSTLGSLFHL